MSEAQRLHHECGSIACHRRIPMHYFACGQHRSLLGWDLNIRLQTAWLERRWDRERFERTRAEAFALWDALKRRGVVRPA
jgi:hypothetical protein